MKFFSRTSLVFLILISVTTAFAQGHAGSAPGRGQGAPLQGGSANLEQDPNVDYGDGGGGSTVCYSGCYTASTGRARCSSETAYTGSMPTGYVVYSPSGYGSYATHGYSSCRAYNVSEGQEGPGYCVLSGYGNCRYRAVTNLPARAPSDDYTLTQLLGDDAMAVFMDEVSMRILGLAPAARVDEEARLYAGKLKEVQRLRLGVGEDEHVVIPRPAPAAAAQTP